MGGRHDADSQDDRFLPDYLGEVMTNKQRKAMRQALGISGHTGIAIPRSQVHGSKSRRSERRKAKQQARTNGWEA